MKQNLVFFALAFFASCTPSQDDLAKSPPGGNSLVGTWQEYGPKIPKLENGVVIDSVDINARFQFLNDSTYIAENDIYTASVSGTWSFDTTTYNINLFPQGPLGNNNSDHNWGIYKLDSADLEVIYLYKVNLPEHSYTVLRERNFKRTN